MQVKFIDKNKNRNEFFATLRKRVDQHFRDQNISRHHNREMVVKTVVLLSAYLLPFTFILALQLPTAANFALWSLMGIALSGVGMSVMHDANHGSYSSSSRVNYWLGHTLNLLGGSVPNWKIQHNVLHHTYTNIAHLDDDIDDKVILRFSPHTPVKWYHRYQFIYAFIFYGVTTVYWALLKDFLQFKRYDKEGLQPQDHTAKRNVMWRLILSKIGYFTVTLALPLLLLHKPAGLYIAGFLWMHFVAGLVLTVTFQLAHTVEDTTHPLPDEAATIDNAWAIHQMNTTVNFSRNSRFITWFVGGLNYQVEHHLFPNICHVHYPRISVIVKSTANEFGIPYLERETLKQAIGSHVQTLKRFGKTEPVV